MGPDFAWRLDATSSSGKPSSDATSGIDINLLVYRTPDHIIRTDACEFGLGGYSLTTGLAWRWKVPRKDQQQNLSTTWSFLPALRASCFP